jgi:signal transduction histidine kinase
MRRPGERATDRLTAAIVIGTITIAAAGLALTVIAWGDMIPADSYPNLFSSVSVVLYVVPGALIVRRARNLVGWILQAVGVGLALVPFTSTYAVVGIVSRPGSLPAPHTVGAFAEPIFIATTAMLAFVLFVFPTGTLRSPAWRPVAVAGIVAALVMTIGFAVVPPLERLPAPGGASLTYPNPWATSSAAASTVLVAAAWIVALAAGAAFVSLVLRYRTGGADERQRIKWIALAAATELVLLLASLVPLLLCGCDRSPVTTVLLLSAAVVVFAGVPAALAVAILRYRLFDIDVIINRAIVYALIAGTITGLYFVFVVAVGSFFGYGVVKSSPALTAVAAVLIAVLFQPLRLRARRVANRLIYGERATPYQVLSEFADRMSDAFSLDDVLERMASILAAGTGATRVDVWLRLGDDLRPVATWPTGARPTEPVRLSPDGELPPFDGSLRATAVRHGDELLGALTLRKPPGELLNPTEEKLLADLASQAGLVLRNVRLAADLQASLEDLRASRRRLVEAQDAERRKIERNLHDGAQQQLVALNVQLGLLERVSDDPERVREMTTRIRGALGDALDDLRDLARGIYPPLLADKGLAAAIGAQARKAPVPTTVTADGIGRFAPDVEAAVYFCTLEALQNVGKYADASSVTVAIGERDGMLEFLIQDDGRGFDHATAGRGSGLQGMIDRLDAIGGTISIESHPGAGTAVRGRVPIAAT